MDETDAPVSYGTCIVCQEELNNSKVFGSLGLLHPSKIIKKHPDGHNLYLDEILSSPSPRIVHLPLWIPRSLPKTQKPEIRRSASPLISKVSQTTTVATVSTLVAYVLT